MTVRVARADDFPAIRDLALDIQAKTVYADYEADPQAFLRYIARTMHTALGKIFVSVDEDDEVRGFLVMEAHDYVQFKGRYATDFMFISTIPGDGAELMRVGTEWAWGIPGVKDVTFAVSSGVHPESTGDMYTNAGYEFVGGNYMQVRP